MKLIGFLVILSCIFYAAARFEDQAFKFDWKQQYIGKKPSFYYFQLGTSSMTSKLTGSGDDAVPKKPLQFSAINSDL